jgi:hypothetical protein
VANRQVTRGVEPAGFNAAELWKFGVEIVSTNPVHLRCSSCGAGWSPAMLPSRKLPKGYWQCPTGCNLEGPNEPSGMGDNLIDDFDANKED